jgi:hypothetical protein
MAAEALYTDEFALPGTTATGPIDPLVLIKGNKHSSVFTPTDAADFAVNWTVVEHKSL